MVRRRIASTACFALISRRGSHAFPIKVRPMRSFKMDTDTFARRRKMSSPRASQSDSTLETSSLPEAEDGARQILHGTTLVSIQECVAAFDQEQRQRRAHQGPRATRSSKVVFVDGSWYHRPDPATGLNRNPAREYVAGPRLPRARFLDIDAIATTAELFPEQNPKGLPHMMPPPRLFGLAMDAYDIRNDDHVVVYARRGALFTPRVWFLFVSMGHDAKKVHLMQGSLEDYMEEGGTVETDSLLTNYNNKQNGDGKYRDTMGESYVDCFDGGILNVPRLYHTHYSTTMPQYNLNVFSAKNICEKEEVLDAVNNYLDGGDVKSESAKESFSNTVILDTRGTGYAKKGHMPSAVHLPYTQIATPTNSLMIQPKQTLKKLFEDRGVDYLDPELKIILSCGSGVSVCHGYLALKELGRNITEENTRIYDGSWTEWGKEDDLPKILPDKNELIG